MERQGSEYKDPEGSQEKGFGKRVEVAELGAEKMSNWNHYSRKANI